MSITNLNLASSNFIRSALPNLKGNYASNLCWVNPSNVYIDDTTVKINNALKTSTLNEQDAIDYIAGSVFIHCLNGWTYLSTSIHSLLEGDYGNAIHAAYYAELRGIMSFLASEGVGVFNTGNLIVDNSGRVQKANCSQYGESKTHPFAKLALDQWLTDANNSTKLIDIIKVDDKSINQWITATGFPSATFLPGMLAKGWLNEWSFDISQVKNDQDLRNVVSYRPQRFNLGFSQLHELPTERIKFVEEIWSLCNPSETFEKMLWRFSLEYVYKELFQYPSINALDRKKDLAPLFVELGKNPNSDVNIKLMDFLARTVDAIDSPIFDRAKHSISTVQENQIEPFGIISRACLILNFATRAAQNLLLHTRTTRKDLQFWTDNVGAKSGLWEIDSEPSLFSDLWEDVAIELEEIKKWRVSSQSPTQYDLRNKMHHKMLNIKQFNRAYLWNLKLQ